MASPEGWTYRVAMNVARRRLRRQSMEARLLRRVAPDSSPPESEFWAIVSGLPDRQRQAVVLRHVGQLRESEIGEAMGITRGAVSSTLRAAYRSLKVDLTDTVTEEVS